MIRELLGKNKEEEEETYIYIEEGDRIEIMEIPEKFIGTWLINIYQKAKKNRLLLLAWKRRYDGEDA